MSQRLTATTTVVRDDDAGATRAAEQERAIAERGEALFRERIVRRTAPAGAAGRDGLAALEAAAQIYAQAGR